MEKINRLNDIINGPWAKNGEHVEMFLANAETTKLEHVFRAHWEGPIISKGEIEIRDSFDEALTVLQLIELAVETGYLELEDVQEYSRNKFDLLLKDKSTHKFLHNYGYLTILFLAKRLNIKIDNMSASPPDIDHHASFRFASFFSTFLSWYENKEIQLFLRFLDHYVFYGNDRETLKMYLQTGQALNSWGIEEKQYFDDLSFGAYQFVVSLDDLFGLMSEDQTKYFGSFFSYWIAAFFGYQYNEKKFVKKHTDWSQIPIHEKFFSNEGIFENVQELKKIFNQRLDRLRKVWENTLAFLEEYNATAKLDHELS